MGHYYWERLFLGRHADECLTGFRSLFGDEREDYAQALAQIPLANWARL
jgi:hypothetical protein